MSLVTLSNAAMARRSDFAPTEGPPRNSAQIANAAAAQPAPIGRAAGGGAGLGVGGSRAGGDGAVNSTPNLQALTTYIPTEVIAVYLAFVSLQTSINAGNASAVVGTTTQRSGVGMLWLWLPFGFFLVTTPLAAWATFATKLRSLGKPLPLSYACWPVWEMFAATVSFIAWACAIPNNPFQKTWPGFNGGYAGFIVLLVSTILGFLAPLFQKPLGTSAA